METFTPPDPATAGNLADKLQGDAYTYASDSPLWKETREEWWACLRKNGLEPRTSDGAWLSEQAEALLTRQESAEPSSVDKAEEIRIAVAEAQCNQDVRMTQRLGDLEASYQAPLIEANKAALNEEKTRKQDYLATARTYLASSQ
ncbi:MAG: hypothetical protein WAL27_16560 [Cellulosimicrobium cellulans]